MRSAASIPTRPATRTAPLVVCGDGLTQGTEECDDGNTTSDDGCSATCTDEPSACGNGVVEYFAGEVCDDSDTAAGDGCGSTCQSNETCGNGFVDTIRGEQCDDGGSELRRDARRRAGDAAGRDGRDAARRRSTLNPDDTLTYDVDHHRAQPARWRTSTSARSACRARSSSTSPAARPIWSGTTAALTAEQKAQLKAGQLYVNVHTAANPSGEIRGQIGFAPPASRRRVQRGLPVERDLRQRRDRRRDRRGLRRRQPRRRRRLRFDLPVRGVLASRARRRSGRGPSASRRQRAGSSTRIVGLGTPGRHHHARPPMSLTASATDASGSATVTLDADVIVTIDISLGGTVQCLKFLRRRRRVRSIAAAATPSA